MEELGRLPGIGPKTAQRLSFYILRAPRESVDRLATALVEVKGRIRFCNDCFFIAEGERCTICLSARRDRTVLCVVEEPLDVLAIERTAEYHGLYHVLHGALSPIDGVGPAELKIGELVARLRREPVSEVILATDRNGRVSRALPRFARSVITDRRSGAGRIEDRRAGGPPAPGAGVRGHPGDRSGHGRGGYRRL